MHLSCRHQLLPTHLVRVDLDLPYEPEAGSKCTAALKGCLWLWGLVQRGNADTGSILCILCRPQTCRFSACVDSSSVGEETSCIDWYAAFEHFRSKAEHLGIRFYPYPLVYAIGGHAQDSAALNSFWLLDAFAQVCTQSFFFKMQNNKAVLSRLYLTSRMVWTISLQPRRVSWKLCRFLMPANNVCVQLLWNGLKTKAIKDVIHMIIYIYIYLMQRRTTPTPRKTRNVAKSSAQGAQFKQVPLLQEEVWTPQAHGKTSQWRWQGHAEAWASFSSVPESQNLVKSWDPKTLW